MIWGQFAVGIRTCTACYVVRLADVSQDGMFKAQYDVLRANGHSPSEAFNETVEEATQSPFPLIGQHGSVLWATA